MKKPGMIIVQSRSIIALKFLIQLTVENVGRYWLLLFINFSRSINTSKTL